MKKFVSMLLAALMLCALCIPAMAEGADVLEEPNPTTVELQPEKSEEDEETPEHDEDVEDEGEKASPYPEDPSDDEDLPTEEAVVNNTAARFGSLVLRYGSGTAEDPYVITAAYQMNNLAEETNKGTSDFAGVYFKLGMSISLNLSAPIGTEEHPFKGNFDGGGNSIQLIVNKENQDYVGLFGYAVGSRLENIVIQPVTKTCKITGNNYVGSVCGYLVNGSINNCTNAGEVSGGGDYVGGICGWAEYSSITNCTNAGEVSGKENVGGICGWADYSSITNCTNAGKVSGDKYVGGIGGNILEGDMFNCTNEGLLMVEINYGGGLCGTAGTRNTINCINSGTIVGSDTYGPYMAGLFSSCTFNAGYTQYQNCICVGEFLNDNMEPTTKYCGNLFGTIHAVHGYAGATGSGVYHFPEGTNLFYDNSAFDQAYAPGTFQLITHYQPGRTTEQMKSDEMLATLNQFVSDHPELELLSWDRNPETGYPCLVFPEAAPTANGAAVSIIEDIPMEADQAPSGEEPDEQPEEDNTAQAEGNPDTPPEASALSEGNIWIIVAAAVIVIGGVAALVIVKKKQSEAIHNS